jgi:hypothetical protein
MNRRVAIRALGVETETGRRARRETEVELGNLGVATDAKFGHALVGQQMTVR